MRLPVRTFTMGNLMLIGFIVSLGGDEFQAELVALAGEVVATLGELHELHAHALKLCHAASSRADSRRPVITRHA